MTVRGLRQALAYWSWQVPRLRRYCHRCERPMWGWQECGEHPRASYAIGPDAGHRQ